MSMQLSGPVKLADPVPEKPRPRSGVVLEYSPGMSDIIKRLFKTFATKLIPPIIVTPH